MKLAAIMSLALLTSLTLPCLASESQTSTSSMSIENATEGVSTPKVRIDPQLGISSMGYSGAKGGSASEQISGGVTTELGSSPSHLLETGVLILNTNAQGQLPGSTQKTKITASYFAIPMMAKIRFAELKSQSWYGKVGFMTAFQMASNHADATNHVDILGSLGIGGRFAFTRKADLMVEATYNQGMIDALKGSGSSMNQGFLVLTGMSFRL